MQQLQLLQQQVHTKDQQLQAKVTAINERERDNHQIRQELQEKDHMIETHIRRTVESEREKYQIRQQLREKDQVIEARERQLRELNHQLQAHEQATAEFQQNVMRRDRIVGDLETRLSEKEGLIQQLQQRLRISDDSITKQKASGEAGKKIELQWKNYGIQHPISYTQPAVDGNKVYFTSHMTVVACDTTGRQSQLPQCPRGWFALTIVNGLLTAVGGMDGMNSTNKLLSLVGRWMNRKWVEHFPPMPTRRCSATALCTGKYLIVAGGKIDAKTITDKVEVMNTDALQWTNVSSLPYPVYLANASLCGDDVYLLGGYQQTRNGTILSTTSVFRCSLNALIQYIDSCHVWQQVANLPVTDSASATIQGRLLAIGGKDSSRKPTTAIHEYNPATNSWEVVSHMFTACSKCAVTVLPGSRLMVADCDTDTGHYRVQIGTLQ